MEGSKGPVSHLEIGWVIGGEVDDGNILDGERVCHTLLVPEPPGQQVCVVPADEGHVVRGIGLVSSKYLKHPNHLNLLVRLVLASMMEAFVVPFLFSSQSS